MSQMSALLDIHSFQSPDIDSISELNSEEIKLVVILCGLPARGKSYISKKLTRYLNWIGSTSKVFNAGNTRRLNQNLASNFEFFNSSDPTSKSARDAIAMETLNDLIVWLSKPGHKVGIHDATNTTIARRKILLEFLAEYEIPVLFLESICTDEKVLEQNVKMKLMSPDYINMDPVVAMTDFKQRMANYEKVYETIGDYEEQQELSYVKVVNVGRKIIAHNIQGFTPSQIVFYLMNIHIHERSIWITRHGESKYNIENRIGGDPDLTPYGKSYGKALSKFISEKYQNGKLLVWTSLLRRTFQTVQYLPDLFEIKTIKTLNEIYAGNCEHLTYDEIYTSHPDEIAARRKDKLRYRYINGESYLDVIERLRSVIIELERMQSDCLIVTHNAVMRTILSYFLGLSHEDMTSLGI
eukprot:NODE_496_length_7738_cov_0.394031.p1 type:complete len:411 gc:universal NODE_496_length_7738_cov_0.394031:6428-7660(+)